MMLFQGRDAGVMILIKMIEMAGQQSGAEPLKVSYADLGSRFGVSRTHASFWRRPKSWILFA
jgi:hypothetical protein